MTDRSGGPAAGARRVGLLACAALFTACGGGEGDQEVELPVENGDGQVVEPGAGAVGVGIDRADSMAGTLVVEGTPEPTVFRLYRSRPGFTPAFSTYLPQGFRPEAAGPDTIRFRMGSGPAVFEVVSLPPGTTRGEARQRAEEMVGAGRETRPFDPGALVTLLGSVDGRTARADLVRHGNRHVVLMLRYPPEYGDGVEPRSQAIREAWIWSEDGSPLIGS